MMAGKMAERAKQLELRYDDWVVIRRTHMGEGEN